MIVMRFALPVRSPMPLIVPCTCVAPASTAASVLATAQPASSWQWMPSATPGSASRDDGHDRARSAAAASRRWCRTARRARRRPRRRRAGSRARSRGRRAKPSKKCSASSSTRLPSRDEEGDRLADHREVLLARDAHDLLDVQQRASCRRACRPARSSSASTRRPSSSSAATSRRRVMPKATISLRSQALAGEQLEQLLLLGVRRREAGLDQVDAERRRARARRAASPRR